jgi:hypothetical protein
MIYINVSKCLITLLNCNLYKLEKKTPSTYIEIAFNLNTFNLLRSQIKSFCKPDH